MTRNEAITILAWCIPLAAKLDAQGVDIELTTEDRASLAGFKRVWITGWLDDSDIYRQAELTHSDIAKLTYMAAQVQAEEMRRQHASGEQVD